MMIKIKLAVFSFIILLTGSFSAYSEVGNQLWTFQAGDSIFASPTIDGEENVYVGSLDGKLYCVDAAGLELWSAQTGDWIESSAALSPDENTVYVGSWDNKLYAINAENGSTLWSFETGSLISSSPSVADDGSIYFGGTDGFLYGLNSDGTLKWGIFVGGEMDSSVAIGTSGELYVASSEGIVYSFDEFGQELWSFEIPEELGATGREALIVSSCMLSGSGELYVGCSNYFFYALDTIDGSMLWNFETSGEIDASPTMSIDGNILMSSRDGFVYSLNSEGGLVWKTDIGVNFYTSAVVDEVGRIYVSSYISETLSYLNLLSPDGVILQQVAFPDIIDSSVSLSPEGILYLGAYDGNLYAFKNGARLSNSVWPKFRQGLASRGELGGYIAPTPGYERLYNIALRGSPLGGENDIIAGFYVVGTGEKDLLIRGVGPGLESGGVSMFMENPIVGYHNSNTLKFHENDDWGDSASAATLAEEMARIGGSALEEGSADSAEILSFGEGGYTAIISNGGGTEGVALLEVFDADVGAPEASLVNVSIRGRSGLGEEVMIAGFVIDGNLPKRVLIRAIGQGLEKAGVVDFLADPTLRLFRGQEVLDSNDDWDAHIERNQLEGFMNAAGAGPLDEGSGDSALFVWLEPGLYTAIVAGNGGQSGVALFEIFDLTGK
jgi:outer membrane protein assembly factor BamB